MSTLGILGKNIAIEIVRLSYRDELVTAAREDTLPDLIEKYRAKLQSRIGDFSDGDERRAVRVLAVACDDVVEEGVTDAQIISYITHTIRDRTARD